MTSAPPIARPARRAVADAGFTLLEVLVALLIAVPVLVVLYRQGIAAVGSTRAAAFYEEALSRAQSRLDALGPRSLQSSEREGDDGGGYHWRTRIAALGTVEPARTDRRDRRGTTLYAVTVEVSWPGEGEARRRVVLETRRLGPAEAMAP